MIRSAFERELHDQRAQVLALGSEVEENLVTSVQALLQRDLDLSRRMIDADEWVNEKRITIILECLSLIARQQPMAGDMRHIASMIEIAGELERIHDYIKGVGKISVLLDDRNVPSPIADLLSQMAQITRRMLRKAMDSFATKDAQLARSVPLIDDQVDDLYNRVYREIFGYLAENPRELEHANHVEWAVHNLERSADRVTNICEWVVYMITGEYVEMDSEFEAPPRLEN